MVCKYTNLTIVKEDSFRLLEPPILQFSSPKDALFYSNYFDSPRNCSWKVKNTCIYRNKFKFSSLFSYNFGFKFASLLVYLYRLVSEKIKRNKIE